MPLTNSPDKRESIPFLTKQTLFAFLMSVTEETKIADLQEVIKECQLEPDSPAVLTYLLRMCVYQYTGEYLPAGNIPRSAMDLILDYLEPHFKLLSDLEKEWWIEIQSNRHNDLPPSSATDNR
jgi:hypothetical protein